MNRPNPPEGRPCSRVRSATIHPLVIVCLAGSFLAAPCEGGAKLSDAAKETAKPPAEQRTLVAREAPPPASEPKARHWDRAVNPADVECAPPVASWPPPVQILPSISLSVSGVESYFRPNEPRGPALFRHAHLGTMVMVSSLGSADFATSTLYGLKVSTGGRRTALDLALIGGRARFAPGSDIAQLLRDPREYGIEASVRRSVTAPYAPFGLAPVVGVRVGVMTWRYLNGIRLETEGHVRDVDGDRINHYTPYVGLAATFLRSRHVEIAATGLTGWRYYGRESKQGLENDLFGQDRLNELRLESRILL